MTEDIIEQPRFPERLHPGSPHEMVVIEYVMNEVVKTTEPCTRDDAEKAMFAAVRAGYFGTSIKWAIIRPLVR